MGIGFMILFMELQHELQYVMPSYGFGFCDFDGPGEGLHVFFTCLSIGLNVLVRENLLKTKGHWAFSHTPMSTCLPSFVASRLFGHSIGLWGQSITKHVLGSETALGSACRGFGVSSNMKSLNAARSSGDGAPSPGGIVHGHSRRSCAQVVH